MTLDTVGTETPAWAAMTAIVLDGSARRRPTRSVVDVMAASLSKLSDARLPRLASRGPARDDRVANRS